MIAGHNINAAGGETRIEVTELGSEYDFADLQIILRDGAPGFNTNATIYLTLDQAATLADDLQAAVIDLAEAAAS